MFIRSHSSFIDDLFSVCDGVFGRGDEGEDLISRDNSDLGLAILKAREDERRRIARDLHDGTAQLLLRLEFDLDALRRGTLVGREKAHRSAHDVIDQLHRQVRCMSYLLHPPELERFGLAGALDALCLGMTARSGIEISFAGHETGAQRSGNADLALFRIAQAALTNVFKHSGAQRAELRLRETPNWLVLRIRDFGAGIRPQVVGKVTENVSGVGISGMRARMAALAGRVTVRALDQGTAVTAMVPRVMPPWPQSI